MAQPAAKTTQTATEMVSVPLAKGGEPHTMRVLTSIPLDDKGKEAATFNLGMPHPHMQACTIVRMYTYRGVSVEAYSLTREADGKVVGFRTVIPWGAVRLIEEGMGVETFVAEVQDAEEEHLNGGGEEPDEPEAAAAGGAAHTNGSPS
jgi:hypothetical protein